MYWLRNEVQILCKGCSTKFLYPFQDISHAVCSYCRLPFPNAKDAVLHCAHEHPNEKVEPGESLQSPGRAPVNRHYAGTHRGYTGIRPRQSCGNAPV
ncbi:hypothetical protein DPMN_106544 [Dreissena polymorpha]|uniref:Uncharacterized protein n=1 Tax=Dreissena polymorpha TaxID=45954 RepID=A0A9D4K5E6_DREPO|nr:hypothetical protein DPMN_106544 [Dreissena polymorpha]